MNTDFIRKLTTTTFLVINEDLLKDVETSNLVIVKLVYLSMNAIPVSRYRRKHR